MIDWKKTILKTNVKIQDVVNNLNETSMKIVLIVDSKNFFIGSNKKYIQSDFINPDLPSAADELEVGKLFVIMLILPLM